MKYSVYTVLGAWQYKSVNYCIDQFVVSETLQKHVYIEGVLEEKLQSRSEHTSQQQRKLLNTNVCNLKELGEGLAPNIVST